MPFIADDPSSWGKPEVPRPEVLMLDQMFELLADEEHWYQGDLSDGKGAYCLVGALNQVVFGDPRAEVLDHGEPTPAGFKKAEAALIRTIERVYVGDGCDSDLIVEFNDDDETEHEDILEVIRRARGLLTKSSTEENADAVR